MSRTEEILRRQARALAASTAAGPVRRIDPKTGKVIEVLPVRGPQWVESREWTARGRLNWRRARKPKGAP
jgi:hypothetical protein